jgi:adenosylhomocysteine nucleosidase
VLKVLVTFAVDDEFAPWRKLRKFQRIEEEKAVEAYRINVSGLEVWVLLTGIGRDVAAASARAIIWAGDIDICISSGLAGALKSEYSVGDVVVAHELVEVSGNGGVECDGLLLKMAMHCGAKEVRTMHSVDHVVVSAAEKNDLGKSADVVDMESCDILFEARAFGGRVIAIRAISDSSEEDMPIDFNRVVTKDGAVSIPRVLGEVMKRPSTLASLVRFGRQSRASAEKLAEFLDRYVECLAASNISSEKVAL